jgi:hypothetical protein
VERGGYLPKPLYDVIAFSVSSIIGMFFPIVYVHFCNSADEKFQFAFVKDVDQVLWDEFIEPLSEILELFVDSFLDTPTRDKTGDKQTLNGGPYSTYSFLFSLVTGMS